MLVLMASDFFMPVTEDIDLEIKQYEPIEQYGPLRWYDKEMRCASRGCSSPTYCKVQGIPYCTMHSLRRLNEMLVEKGVNN
jgi:hypothetical protein